MMTVIRNIQYGCRILSERTAAQGFAVEWTIVAALDREMATAITRRLMGVRERVKFLVADWSHALRSDADT